MRGTPVRRAAISHIDTMGHRYESSMTISLISRFLVYLGVGIVACFTKKRKKR